MLNVISIEAEIEIYFDCCIFTILEQSLRAHVVSHCLASSQFDLVPHTVSFCTAVWIHREEATLPSGFRWNS